MSITSLVHHAGGLVHRPRRSLAAALVALTVAVIAAAPGLAQDGAGFEDEWRDLAGARAELAGLRSSAAQGRAEIRVIEAEIVELARGQRALSEQEAAYVAMLSDAQSRARRLAVQAYISGGASRGVQYLLDSDTAADLTWRNHMLGEHAGTIQEASGAFVELRAAADRDQIQLAGEVDRLSGRIDDITLEVTRTEARIADAEWRVEIAEIHALADESFEKSGRPDPTAEEWSRLRFCESTWNYQTASGNGFYGAYQFDYSTWFTVGGTGLASDAPPEEQDARARLLYARRGSQPWPVCGHFLPDGAVP